VNIRLWAEVLSKQTRSISVKIQSELRSSLVSKFKTSRRKLSDEGDNVGISGILNGHDANAMEASAGSAEFNIVALKVDNLGATENCEVLEFGLADRGAIVGNDHKLGWSIAELLLGQFVA
jgi:hypothetical protein